VIHRDLVPGHVERLAAEAKAVGRVDTAVGDARNLDIEDESVDALLMLGPLYHLTHQGDRVHALREARRILRSDRMLFAAAMSRWAPRLHGVLVMRLYRQHAELAGPLEVVETTGRLPPLVPGEFSGYCHRPEELREEVTGAGFDVVELMSVEGLAFALPDLEERLAPAEDARHVLEAARDLGAIPEPLGVGPHLLVSARRRDSLRPRQRPPR